MNRRWPPLVAAWTAFGLAQGLIRTATALSPAALPGVLGFDVPLALAWGAATPLIGWWDRVLARRTSSGWLRVAGHLPLLVVLAVLHTALRRGLAGVLFGPVTVPFAVTLQFFADVTVASYVAAAWVARTLDAERGRAARERRTDALRSELAGARVRYLDMQLRPHFLFNTLGAISELAHESPAIARRMLGNVTQLLEAGVSEASRTRVTLGEELDALRPYLEIQRLRFQDWLAIEESVDADARQALVPAFILQPLVENAVHHGLKGRTEAGRIAVRARREDARLVVEVVDNGVGLVASSYQQRRGLGLENVRDRLAAVYPGEGMLSLRDGADGTAARLEIPFEALPPGAPAHPKDADDAAAPATVASAPEFALLRGPRLVGAIAGGWAIVALFRIQHSISYLWQRDRLTLDAFTAALRFDVIVAAVWLALTPLALLVLRAVPLRRPGIAARAVFHVLAGTGISLAHAALTAFVLAGFDPARWEGPLRELFAWNVAIYAILLVLWHLRVVQRWTEERDAVDQRLRHDLDVVRFRRTVLEVRPDALVLALRALADTVGTDPRRAEVVLADIGDFLRGTLDTLRDSHVPLRDEAAAVAAYGRVLAAGVVPALEVRVAIPLHLMEVRVPNGLLRALLDAATNAPGSLPPSSVTIGVSGAATDLVAYARGERPGTLGPGPARARLDAYAGQGAIAILDSTTEVRVRVLPSPASGSDVADAPAGEMLAVGGRA